ncbi:putative protein phosphatase 2C 12 [Vitis vinifera]|uniref:PPM-type phosphatase domain-containing protein n=1 Tax=Vitis vinifera TaxID=29760 RepID=A0A438FR90_VITVI|nr:putative protein phosphatase 2C 12 [Vitis vinifera]
MYDLFGPPHFPSLQVRESDELKEIFRGHEIEVSEDGISEVPSVILGVVSALRADKASFGFFYVLTDEEIRQGLKVFSNGSEFPPLYCESGSIGGGDIIMEILRRHLALNNTCLTMMVILNSQSWERWSKAEFVRAPLWYPIKHNVGGWGIGSTSSGRQSIDDPSALISRWFFLSGYRANTEEDAVVSHAQVQQHHMPSSSPIKDVAPHCGTKHNNSILDQSDHHSASRNHDSSRFGIVYKVTLMRMLELGSLSIAIEVSSKRELYSALGVLQAQMCMFLPGALCKGMHAHYCKVSQSKKMEDFILLKTKCQRVIGDGVSTYLVFGLFDRHNGFAAALYSKENLLNDVLAAIPPELSKDEWVAVLPRTSVAGFVETDMDFKEEAQTSGITITFVTIEGWVVIVASIGDSRCIFESAEGDIYHDGINANNAQPDFIPSCENLIGINLIE